MILDVTHCNEISFSRRDAEFAEQTNFEFWFSLRPLRLCG